MTRLLSLRLRLNSRPAIRTLDLDENEALLTNYAANKRELTAIKAQSYFTSLPTMCIMMIIARHLFCGLLETTNTVGDGIMVRGFVANFLASYARKLICEIIGL